MRGRADRRADRPGRHRGLGIRMRLAALVAAVFAVAATIGAVAIVTFVHHRLVESTRRSAVR